MHERDRHPATARQQEPRYAASLGCSRAAKTEKRRFQGESEADRVELLADQRPTTKSPAAVSAADGDWRSEDAGVTDE